MSDYESRIIEFEHARNEAVDKWFKARPDVVRTRDKEFLLESGFRLAWDFQREPEQETKQ